MRAAAAADLRSRAAAAGGAVVVVRVYGSRKGGLGLRGKLGGKLVGSWKRSCCRVGVVRHVGAALAASALRVGGERAGGKCDRGGRHVGLRMLRRLRKAAQQQRAPVGLERLRGGWQGALAGGGVRVAASGRLGVGPPVAGAAGLLLCLGLRCGGRSGGRSGGSGGWVDVQPPTGRAAARAQRGIGVGSSRGRGSGSRRSRRRVGPGAPQLDRVALQLLDGALEARQLLVLFQGELLHVILLARVQQGGQLGALELRDLL